MRTDIYLTPLLLLQNSQLAVRMQVRSASAVATTVLCGVLNHT
jgi:hypothetical protein